jgi:HSP20 family protein
MELTNTYQNNKGASCSIIPPVDIIEETDRFLLKADMPGITKDGLDVKIDNDELTISGKYETDNNKEYSYSEFTIRDYSRSFRVSNGISTKDISASLENGVLTLILPKSEEIKPRKIDVKVAS